MMKGHPFGSRPLPQTLPPKGIAKELKRSRKGVEKELEMDPPSPPGDALVMLWDALGTLWECLGDVLGMLWDALGHSGML